ncbi:MAG: ROK family transcriptional regulator, partial [Anaerolineaceae bacterium]
MPTKKATHQQTKQHNRDLVLKTIFDHESISRAEIARVTELTRTTVSELVSGLLSEGLVKEVGFGSSMGGKSPILLSLVGDSRYLIGLNLAQVKFYGAVVNLRGEIKEIVEVPVIDENGKHALEMVYEILDRLIGKNWQPMVGIGIGTPGLVNTQEGIVVNAVNLDWQDLQLGQLLRDRYHLPVSIMNDSQAAAMGEYVYGEDRMKSSNLIVINVQQGIGAGILVNGRLFQGDGGGAGEIGHVVVQENGLLCRCGKRGCLETLSSARAIIQLAKAQTRDFIDSTLADNPGEITLDVIRKAFLEGDILAKKIVLQAAHYLGTSIANLIGTLNIHKIILTGEVTNFGKEWLDTVHESMIRASLVH